MASPAPEPAVGLRFGRFEVDPRTGELRKDGLKVRLQDQPFQVLMMLLDRPGEVVAREEMRRRLWPADTFVSFDQGLNNAVRRLRDALGDSAEAPRFVETLPRLGYRFVAPVERFPLRAGVRAEEEPGAQAPSPPVAAPPAPARRGRLIAAAAALAGLAAGAGLTAAMMGRPSAAEPPALRYLTHSGQDHSPAFSPDGRTVAFVSTRDGRSRIWLARLDSGEEAALTEGPDHRPRFAPDGSAVLFVRDAAEGGGASLFRVGVVGGEVRRVLEDANGGDWSPDGRRLAFLRYARASSPMNVIGVAAADGSAPRELARVQALWITPPRWSPDGRRLALTHAEGAAIVSSTLVVDADSGEQVRLAPPLAFGALSAPAWSPSGRALVLAQSEMVHGRSRARLIRQDFPSGQARVLMHQLAIGAGLDAAGDRVVFDAPSARGNLLEEAVEPASGSGRRWLTRGFAEDRQPAYAPDGEHVVFSSDRSGNRDLWQLSLASGRLRRLTDHAADDIDPHVMADGRLLWSSKRGGAFEVWTAAADGGDPRQVSRDGFDAENPAATPDGQWVVYASSHPDKRGLWKVRFDGSEATQLVAATVGLPEVSPDGTLVLFSEYDPPQTRLRVVRLADGAAVPFQVTLSWRSMPLSRGELIRGRARWRRDGRSIAYVEEDAQGRSGVMVQEFAPGRDTTATRRPLAGFDPDRVTETFGFSPDGRRITLGTRESASNLVMASGVAGLGE